MKFYYNGKLVRTSQTHTYTHAVLDLETGECIGCRSSEQAAQQLAGERIRWRENEIENLQSAIKALKAGQTCYPFREGKHKGWTRFGPKVLADREAAIARREKRIEECRKEQAWFKENWKVVELEARA